MIFALAAGLAACTAAECGGLTSCRRAITGTSRSRAVSGHRHRPTPERRHHREPGTSTEQGKKHGFDPCAGGSPALRPPLRDLPWFPGMRGYGGPQPLAGPGVASFPAWISSRRSWSPLRAGAAAGMTCPQRHPLRPAYWPVLPGKQSREPIGGSPVGGPEIRLGVTDLPASRFAARVTHDAPGRRK